GLWGTEGAYFATFAAKLDGGAMVTASHNPPDYNGMKFVREEARPISADTGLREMRALIEGGRLPGRAAREGSERLLDIRGEVPGPAAGLVRGSPLPPGEGGGERRQGGRRARRRCARAAPAVRVHQGESRARWHLPSRCAQPDAGGEPRRHGRGGARERRRLRARLGRRLRSLLLLRRSGPVHRGLLP